METLAFYIEIIEKIINFLILLFFFLQEHFLVAKKGERVRLVKDKGNGWSNCLNSENKKGYLPTAYLKKAEAPQEDNKEAENKEHEQEEKKPSHSSSHKESGKKTYTYEIIKDYTPSGV